MLVNKLFKLMFVFVFLPLAMSCGGGGSSSGVDQWVPITGRGPVDRSTENWDCSIGIRGSFLIRP